MDALVINAVACGPTDGLFPGFPAVLPSLEVKESVAHTVPVVSYSLELNVSQRLRG